MTIPLRCVIVIPVYNHGGKIREVVEKTIRFGLPVIVVDDGSTDSTPQVLTSLSGIRVLRHKENQGKGASLLTGFAEAMKIADWAVTIDAGGYPFPAQDNPGRATPHGYREADRNGTWKYTLDQPLGPRIFQLLGLGLMREMAF